MKYIATKNFSGKITAKEGDILNLPNNEFWVKDLISAKLIKRYTAKKGKAED